MTRPTQQGPDGMSGEDASGAGLRAGALPLALVVLLMALAILALAGVAAL